MRPQFNGFFFWLYLRDVIFANFKSQSFSHNCKRCSTSPNTHTSLRECKLVRWHHRWERAHVWYSISLAKHASTVHNTHDILFTFYINIYFASYLSLFSCCSVSERTPTPQQKQNGVQIRSFLGAARQIIVINARKVRKGKRYMHDGCGIQVTDNHFFQLLFWKGSLYTTIVYNTLITHPVLIIVQIAIVWSCDRFKLKSVAIISCVNTWPNDSFLFKILMVLRRLYLHHWY